MCFYPNSSARKSWADHDPNRVEPDWPLELKVIEFVQSNAGVHRRTKIAAPATIQVSAKKASTHKLSAEPTVPRNTALTSIVMNPNRRCLPSVPTSVPERAESGRNTATANSDFQIGIRHVSNGALFGPEDEKWVTATLIAIG
jgi:hypothetical protein